MVINTQKAHSNLRSAYQGNPMNAPRLKSVVVSVGCGKYSRNTSVLESIYGDMMKICAQKPVYSKARKSVSNFNIREGHTIGIFTTLRSHQMFDFLDRLIMIAMPRIQDLQYLSTKSFDANNNYNFGIKRQDIFPEVENVEHFFGMNISINIKAVSMQDSLSLLKHIGLPFSDCRSGDTHAN